MPLTRRTTLATCCLATLALAACDDAGEADCDARDGTDAACVAEGEGAAAEGEGAAAEGEGEAGEGEGEGGEGEGEGGAVGNASRPLPQELVDAINAAQLECLQRLPIVEAIEPGSSSVAAQLANEFLTRLQVAANDATLVLDEGAVAACVADLASPVCIERNVAELTFDECTALLRGTLHDGDACSVSGQCLSRRCNDVSCTCEGDVPAQAIFVTDVDALACLSEQDCPIGEVCAFVDDPSPSPSATFTASCVPACAVDADCGPDALCESDGLCLELGAPPCVFLGNCDDGGDDEGGDDDGGPTPPPPPPPPVDGPGAGEPCALRGNSLCATGFRCDFDTDPFLCVALALVGDHCESDGDCDSGACDGNRDVCVNDVVVGAGEDCSTSLCEAPLLCAPEAAGAVCRPRVTGRAIGDACTIGVDGACPFGLVCGGAGSCEELSVVADGACSTDFSVGPVCAGAFTDRECRTNGERGVTIGVCADRPGIGAICSGACAEGAACVFADDGSRVCVAAIVTGGSCGDPQAVCAAGLVCDDSDQTCKAPVDDLAGVPDTCPAW